MHPPAAGPAPELPIHQINPLIEPAGHWQDTMANVAAILDLLVALRPEQTQTPSFNRGFSLLTRLCANALRLHTEHGTAQGFLPETIVVRASQSAPPTQSAAPHGG